MRPGIAEVAKTERGTYVPWAHGSCVDLFHRVVQQRYADVRAARVRAVRVTEEVAEHRLLRAADARIETGSEEARIRRGGLGHARGTRSGCDTWTRRRVERRGSPHTVCGLGRTRKKRPSTRGDTAGSPEGAAPGGAAGEPLAAGSQDESARRSAFWRLRADTEPEEAKVRGVAQPRVDA